MTEGKPKRAYEDAELWSRLPEGIPPLVHRLNNSLAVLAGVVEFGTPDTLRVAHSEVERLRLALQGLSLLSKPTQGRSELFDLATPLELVSTMLAPLAEARGVRLDVVRSSRPTLLHGDPDALGKVLTLLVLAEVQVLGDRREAGLPARVTVRVLRRRRRASLFVTRTRLDADDEGETELLARLLRAPRALPMQVLFRPLGGALAYRFDFSEALEGEDDAPRPAAAKGRRLVLADTDVDERDTIADFLSSEGYEVSTLDGVGAVDELVAGNPDLILLDERLMRAVPHAIEALRDDRRFRNCVLVLGDGAGDEPPYVLPAATGPRVLARPFRPGDLLEAIRAHLAADPRCDGAARAS